MTGGCLGRLELGEGSDTPKTLPQKPFQKTNRKTMNKSLYLHSPKTKHDNGTKRQPFEDVSPI